MQSAEDGTGTYSHFDLSVKRETNTFVGGKADQRRINIIFTCKRDPIRHAPQSRHRLDSSTSNLIRGIKNCDKRRNAGNQDGKGMKQQDLHQVGSEYSFSKHRALIAMHCATSKRPYNYVKDPYFIKQVQLLRRGTKLPDPTTISRDVLTLYRETAKHLKKKFKVNAAYFDSYVYHSPSRQDVSSAFHLQVDGWTGPTYVSYLGLVVSWEGDGVIHEMILEFIK